MNRNLVGVLLFAVLQHISAVTIHKFPDLDHHESVHHHTAPIPILKSDFQQSKEGYKFSYETANGIHAHEHGYIKNLGDKKHETLVQHGSVTYHDEHGHPITLTYVADEHGFQPQGSHIPTAPPIPPLPLALQKTIDHQNFAQNHHVPIHENFDEDTL